MAAGKHSCANRASNAICKISPLLIISTRSEYQVSVELHSVEGGEEKKKLANVFHLPLSTVPMVQMVGLSQHAGSATGNVSHPSGLLCTILTFLQLPKQVGF